MHKLEAQAGRRMAKPWADRREQPESAPESAKVQQLRRWHRARSWARLIREAEALWHVNVRDLRRLGALELDQLLQEVPPSLKPRVNRWLVRYGALTRLQGTRPSTRVDGAASAGSGSPA
jgi:hypothetical protein